MTPGNKNFVLLMATPEGFITPQGMIRQVLGNLYGLPSSGCIFSRAVDVMVPKLSKIILLMTRSSSEIRCLI